MAHANLKKNGKTSKKPAAKMPGEWLYLNKESKGYTKNKANTKAIIKVIEVQKSILNFLFILFNSFYKTLFHIESKDIYFFRIWF